MILVVGSTGYLGRAVTLRLLGMGKKVRVLVRPGSQHQDLVKAGAQPVLGDLKKPETLVEACRGIDVVVTTANSALRGGEDTVESVDRIGNQALVDASKAAGVRHFSFVSALGADVNSPVPFMAAKAKTEAHLRSSGIEYTILACNMFMDVWAGMAVGMPAAQGKSITLVGQGNRKHSFVALDDVAAFAAKSTDHSAGKNQYVAIGGPRPISWRDVLASYELVLDRKLAVEWIEPGQPIPGLPGPMSQLLANMETYDSPVDMSAVAKTWDIALTSIEEFIRKSAAAK
jgi:NADH dehydrogenase